MRVVVGRQFRDVTSNHNGIFHVRRRRRVAAAARFSLALARASSSGRVVVVATWVVAVGLVLRSSFTLCVYDIEQKWILSLRLVSISSSPR